MANGKNGSPIYKVIENPFGDKKLTDEDATSPAETKDQFKSTTKAERDYIKNLQTKGFTGTYQSSAGKSQAVLDAEKEYRPSEEQQAATKVAEREEKNRKELAAAKAGVAALDDVGDFSQRKNLNAIATQLGMSPEGAYGFLNKYGNLSVLDQNFDPSQMGIEVDPTTRAYGKGFTQANLDNADLDPEDRANLASQGGLASFNVQNMLSNIFGPGGRVYNKEVDEEGKIIHSGKSFFETEAGKQFAGERPQGIAGLGVGAPDPMLETFTKLFENAPTAERRKELEDIFAMMQGFMGMQQPRIGPQTLAYQFGGG
tara:strand:- start:51 stop:992 length:942 start_codon:yes stop_codon:yes gene_type:complete